MLCPEIWQFSPPVSSLKKETGYLDNNCSIKKINDINFTHSVSVVLPETLHLPNALTDILLGDCEYYKVNKISISEFLENEFIENFVKSGSLTAISIDRKIDTEDCVAYIPEGSLILNLRKQSFQELGLAGEFLHHTKHLGDRYIVKIDLKQCHEKGGKTIEHASTCLNHMMPVTLLISWQHTDKSICPSSIAKYFYDKSYDVSQCTPTFTSNTEYSVQVPKWYLDSEEVDHLEFIEWLGMICLQADLESGTPDGYVTSYETPEPNQEIGQVKCLNWTGYFSKGKIRHLLNTLIDYQMKNSEKPWIAIYIQGFSDAPISWNMQEHYWYTNGDNSCIIILQPTNKYLLYTQSCSHKQYK